MSAPIALSASQQERYARHLLLDGLGGEGQERLLAARICIRDSGTEAVWAARYLAASGVGELYLDAAFPAAAAAFCKVLGPDTQVRLGEQAPPDAYVLPLEARDTDPPCARARAGSWAALQAVRRLAAAPVTPGRAR